MAHAMSDMQQYMADLRQQLEHVYTMLNAKKYNQARDTLFIELLGGQVSNRNVYQEGMRDNNSLGDDAEE